MMNKFEELVEEFKTVLGGGSRIIDVVVPPLVFILVNRFASLTIATVSALLIAIGLLALRLARGRSFGYAIGGLVSAGLAALLAYLTQTPSGFFLPGLVSGGLTVGLALLSLLFKRPLAAWSSHLTRGWPLEWYWHPKVRPAYQEVTWGWAVFFGARFYIQLQAYLQNDSASLGIIQLLTGWPALIVVLALSYIYGLWRLGNLQGPSVEEFEQDAEPPWEGQTRGF